MSFLSKIASIAAPIVSVAVPGVGGAVAGLAANVVAAGERKKEIRKTQNRLAQEYENMEFMSNRSTFRDPYAGSQMLTPNAVGSSNSGFFGDVSDFFRSAGGLARDVIGSGIPQLFGYSRPQGSMQQPAVTTITNLGASETQESGAMQGFVGGLVPSLVSGARSLIQSPVGQIGLGTAVGGALSLLDGTGKQIRITRKTKRLAQQAYQLSFGDLSAATSLFAQLSGIAVNKMQFVQILTKRFRNDGAVVTKAALRKTRSTLRKMKSMCDMYNSVAKTPARRRASPMKRASTTLISNK